MHASYATHKPPLIIECDEIEPGLYLGNLDSAENEETLRSLNITHVLTVYIFPLTKPPSLHIETFFIDIDDWPESNILCSFEEANSFIKKGQEKGACLVHCYGGISRSATLVIAFLMQKYSISFRDAMDRVKKKRYCINPNSGFQAQLELYESMGCTLDPENPRYRLFMLQQLGKKVTKAKDFDAIQEFLTESKLNKPFGDSFKCRHCRQYLLHESSIVPHFCGDDLFWHDVQWQHCDVLLSSLCNISLFVEPELWMSDNIKNKEGKLLCPKCHSKIGNFCWTGLLCSCGSAIAPGFRITESKVDRESKITVEVNTKKL